jgi:hypothetical protein
MRIHIRVVAVLLATAAAGCSGEKPAATTPPPPDAKRVDESKAGQIAGRVLFEGNPPANPPVNLATDPFCVRQHPNGLAFENIVVNGGGLENAFVYVKDGLGNYYFDTPSHPVSLDQQGCRYSPHVFGVQTGQPIVIGNSDSTLHNVNAIAKINQGFNFGQQMAGMKQTKTFTAPEVMVRFTCNVHPWMTAYAGVLDHPYFAVTKDGGQFTLSNVPAGTYTVEAWHETLGTQSQSVTLVEKEQKALTFIFKGAQP